MIRDAAKMAARKQKKAEAMKAAGIEATTKRKKNRRNKDSAMMVETKPADASSKKAKKPASKNAVADAPAAKDTATKKGKKGDKA